MTRLVTYHYSSALGGHLIGAGSENLKLYHAALNIPPPPPSSSVAPRPTERVAK